jgi:GntR family transcriptional regulator
VTIDHDGDVPIYIQVADILRARIDSGEIPPRRAIPSKKALQQELEVAAGTVEHALDVLKRDGYLKTVIGRGLYVVPKSERMPDGLPAKPQRRTPRRR